MVPTLKQIFIFFIFSSFLFTACKKEDDKKLVEKFPLHDNWQFRQTDEENPTWHPAVVPGTVHTDLFKNNLIPDPFYGCNERDLQWIGRSNWVYRTTFKADHKLLNKSHINLVFEGLDTYARIFLNNEKILETNNMFRKWQVDCKEYLKKGQNQIEIVFESAENRYLQDSAALGYPLPDGRWNLSRKAAYHFGWDWGPKFITAGIWKPVYFETWDKHHPFDIQLFTTQVNEKQAAISAELMVNSEINEQARFIITERNSGKVLFNEKLQLSPEKQKYEVGFSINDPVLWWTNGLGNPHMYELCFELKTNSGNVWKKHIPYGVRTIEVVNEDDEYGKSLYVRLNGVPLYIKGADYIPQHSFVTEPNEDDYKEIVERAVKTNMNMLRVWGGGIYERDIFYELCSRNGILVWQDFMFACSMYPGDDDFVENVRQEAIEQISRLRNNTCLALWCGNNESDEGWHNWQWQKTYKINKEDSAKIWEGYKRVFRDLLPQTVADYDPGRFYQSTSPMYGWGRKQSMTHGSAHYWGVWWGQEPFEKYIEKVPRFMSEFGFQAMPSLATFRGTQTQEDVFLFSEMLQCHQRNSAGYQTIDLYINRENLRSSSFDGYIYNSQLVQAHGVGMAIEAQRRAKPYCMGTLYWQLNDCWPVVSWSGTDVNGDWKALQYRARQLFEDILVSLIINEGNCEIYVVSDRLQETGGKLSAAVVNFNGDRIVFFDQEINVQANSSQKVLIKPLNEILSGKDAASHIIEVVFTDHDGKVYTNSKFFEKLGSLKLEKPKITKEIQKTEGGYNISLTSDVFVAHLQLYLTDSHAWFDDNFFHLWPGVQKNVFCNSTLDKNDFEEQLKTHFLN